MLSTEEIALTLDSMKGEAEDVLDHIESYEQPGMNHKLRTAKTCLTNLIERLHSYGQYLQDQEIEPC